MRLNLGTVSPSNPAVLAITNAIYRQEGTTQNNNPGNLVYAGQPGAIGQDYRGFAIFDTLASGQQAEQSQVALDINRGTCATGAAVSTLTDLINCLTPPSDPSNNTPAYITAVSNQTGIPADTSLTAFINGTAGNITAAGGSTDTSPDDSTGGGVLSAGIDLTDPVTLVLLAGAGVLAWFYFRN